MDLIITDEFKIKCIELNMAPALALENDKDNEYIVKSILKNIKLIK